LEKGGERDATDLLEFGEVLADDGGRAPAQVTDVPVAGAHVAAERRLQGCGLEEGQHVGQAVRSDGLGGGLDGTLGADQQRRGDQQLRAVRAQLHVLGRHHGRPEVGECRGAVRAERESVRGEAPVRDSGGVQVGQGGPEAREESVVEPLRRHLGERGGVVLEHEERVASGCEARRDHREDRDPGTFGEECGERFVLHLLEAVQPSGGQRVAVPEGRPDRGDQLTVPGVPAVDLDQQRSPRGGEPGDQGYPARGQVGVAQIGRRDAEVGEGVADLGEGEPSPR